MLTAKTCAASLLLFIAVGMPLAYWLAGKKTYLKRVIEFFVTLPLIFPPIALGYMLLIILGRNGWIGSILESIGIRIVFSQGGVILAAFIAGLPLVVKPLQAAFDSAQARELEEAAFVHGLNRFKTAVFVSDPVGLRKSFSCAFARFGKSLGRGWRHNDDRRQHIGPNQYAVSRDF